MTWRPGIDSSLPLNDPHLTTCSALLAYARVLDFWDQSARSSMIVRPGEFGGSVDRAGETVTRDLSGSADPPLKLSVNLYGALRPYRHNCCNAVSLASV